MVLNHWQYKHSELLNVSGPAVPPSGRPPEVGSSMLPGVRPTETMYTGMELPTTEQEVRLAVAKAKAGYAMGLMNCLWKYYRVTIAIHLFTQTI